MVWKALRIVTTIVILVGVVAAASGQSTGPAAKSDAIRENVNAGRIGIISGGVNGTYIRIAADIAAVLDSRDDLRILPIVGKGSVQNITDLLYMRGIDIAIVQSDVLAFLRAQKIHPTIEQRVRYITKLYNEEFHLLARTEIADVAGLEGKSVNFDVSGSGTSMTAETVFDTLGISVNPTNFDQALALEKLKAGEIAAMVYVAGKPTRLYDSLEAKDGVRFLPLPLNSGLLDTYLPARLSHDDYPRLVSDEQPVDTVAVGAVMAIYNWPASHQRFKNLAAFVTVFFDAFEQFQQPPRHAKWQEVNLAAEIPGWKRFEAAESWLSKKKAALASFRTDAGLRPEDERSFQAFLDFLQAQTGGRADAVLTDAERDALFDQYMAWRARFQR